MNCVTLQMPKKRIYGPKGPFYRTVMRVNKMKISFNKIDLPLTKRNFLAVLEQGNSESEGAITDKMIVDWCYRFFHSYSNYVDEHSDIYSDELGSDIAIEVATRWEADLTNTSHRVLSKEQFQEWIARLKKKNA